MKKLCISLGLTALVVACAVDTSEIPTLEVGQEFVDSNVRVVTTDTFTVAVTTFKFDSIVTSGTDRLLVGQYPDEYFGQVKTGTYMELAPLTYSLPSDAELDSVGLVLGYDNYFYNDTTQLSVLNIHELLDELRVSDNVFYNTSSIDFEPTPLFSYSFFPEPIDEDSLFIKLPMEFGEPLFSRIQENTVNSVDELRESFKGFTIQPGESDASSVIGFSANPNRSYLRFFYSIPDEFDDIEETYDFVISLSGLPKVFNAIESNVTGLPLDTLIDEEINLPSSLSNNRGYVQSGIGYVTRIQFPTIKQLFDIPGQGTILSAVLQLKPSPGTYTDLTPIRDSLIINLIDQNNRITERLFFGGEPVYGIINEQLEEFDELIYEIPIGVYLDRELNETNEIDDAFVVFPPEFGRSVDRILLEGEDSEDFRAKLILTYAIYDEDNE
ncbi:MAG: DUF4270 family protein [Bacteroidota bacterium]